MQKCEVCGIEIVLLKSEKRDRIYPKKFCSRKCKSKYSYPKRKEYYKKYYGFFSWQKERKCDTCGKTFIPNYNWQKCCSGECSKIFYKKAHKISCKRWKKDNWNKILEQERNRHKERVTERLSKMPSKNCPLCEKEFHPLEDRLHPYKIYCSSKCQIKFSHKVATKQRNEILKNPSLDPIAYRKHLARKRVQDCNYKAFARGCMKDDDNHISLKSWKDILERYGNKCADCGTTENITIDHIHPISKNGKNNKDNIRPLCRSCNSKKSAKIISIPHTSL